MHVYVYFHHDNKPVSSNEISTVGMNNLIVINDKRITKKLTLVKRINKLVRLYHTAKIGKRFVAITKQDLKIVSGIIHETNGFSFR